MDQKVAPGPPPVYTSQPQGYSTAQDYGQGTGYPPQQPAYGTYPNLAQPAATNTTVIVQQPGVQQTQYRDWKSGVLSCMDDMGICLMGWCCGLCLACQLAGDMNESMCVPCCVPGWLIALRIKLRTQEKIPGSLMDDCCMSMCCGVCVLCQMAREVRYIKLNGGGINN